ncbi:MAG: hypothetical protein J5877_02450 [Clostridia bacterium]|nr:hypothetical protein [Clostridia bacterium]
MKNHLKRALSIVLALLIVVSIFTIIPPVRTEAASSQYVSSTIPDIYKTYITALKKAHPKWKFEFFYTGLEWKDVIAKETDPNVPARSLISYVFPKSYRSIVSKSYDGSTDTYTSYDAGGWYMAAAETVSYYMDPRNFFTDVDMFQFEKLSYDSEIHTIDGVKAILKGSFMDGKKIKNNSGKDVLYAQAYIDAAKKHKVSPYHLAARTIQEVGKNGSGSTSGTNSTYPGIYNFYNIGAYSGSSPITSGLSWASQTISEPSKRYGRPWNSQYKSIVGGAEYIGAGYINNKQNTLYLEKFDVVGEYNNTSLYTHQYMGNITAAYTEGRSVYETYKNLKALENAFTFVIPVYNNMPKTISPIPITADSPWSWLKSLKVDTYKISPSSTMQVSTNNFKVTVPNNVKKVTISAVPYNSKATVSGIPVTTTTTESDTGKVKVESSLKVRTSAGVSSPDENANRLKYNGEYVNLKNGAEIKKLGEQTVGKYVWFKISFTYSGKTLTGWVRSDYIVMDSTTTSSYGKVKLDVGKNTFNIKVTNNGNSRTYVLTITREAAEETTTTTTTEPQVNENDLFKTTYKVDDAKKTISAVPKGTSYKTFIKTLGMKNDTTATVSKGKNQITSGNMATGMVLTAVNGGIEYTYTISVIGDTNGDGDVNVFDIIKARNHILKTAKLKDVLFLSGDVDSNGEINIFDLVKIRNIILGK